MHRELLARCSLQAPSVRGDNPKIKGTQMFSSEWHLCVMQFASGMALLDGVCWAQAMAQSASPQAQLKEQAWKDAQLGSRRHGRPGPMHFCLAQRHDSSQAAPWQLRCGAVNMAAAMWHFETTHSATGAARGEFDCSTQASMQSSSPQPQLIAQV